MKVLLAGELTAGGLTSSLAHGMTGVENVVSVDLYGESSASIDDRSLAARARRYSARRNVGQRLVDLVAEHEPDWLLLVKGRGLSNAVSQVRRSGTKVACYYPDNPFWTAGDPGALERLARCDLAILWSHRIAQRFQAVGGRSAVVPFGYDERWYPPAEPDADRDGIVFLGTWSPRRERYLAALDGLGLTVCGSGWNNAASIPNTVATYEGAAGALLARAAIGINLLHPQCAGAHNMRTREIVAAGAMQLCDPGHDGTPLLANVDCEWFTSPQDLRTRALRLLHERDERIEVARRAQAKTLSDTYSQRAATIVAQLEAA